MTRLNVFQLRLLASGSVLLLVFSVVRLLWYPGAYFAISGVSWPFLVLAGAVLVIGPALSAFVYKPLILASWRGWRSWLWWLPHTSCLSVSRILQCLPLIGLRP